MLYKLNRGFIKLIAEDNYAEGKIKDNTYFNNLDSDFYSTSLEVIKEVIVAELLEKGYNSEDLEIVINACEDNGRIDVYFRSSKNNRYSKPKDNDLALFVINKRNLYNVTLLFYVDTSTDYGKTYQKLFL